MHRSLAITKLQYKYTTYHGAGYVVMYTAQACLGLGGESVFVHALTAIGWERIIKGTLVYILALLF